MGTLYTATCPCGFQHFKLLQGRGMDDASTNFEIFQCKQCHNLVNKELQSIDSLFNPITCPDCKGQLQHISADPGQQQLHCPECQEQTLELTIIGLWD